MMNENKYIVHFITCHMFPSSLVVVAVAAADNSVAENDDTAAVGTVGAVVGTDSVAAAVDEMVVAESE